MIALTTIERWVLDIAHLVGVAAVEHLVDEPLIVGRIVARMELFKPLPVIDKDLFEDVPVPRRLDDHQITPSEGVRCWGGGMFTTSHPLRPPLIGLHRDMRIHLPRPGVMRASGSRKMKNPIRSRYRCRWSDANHTTWAMVCSKGTAACRTMSAICSRWSLAKTLTRCLVLKTTWYRIVKSIRSGWKLSCCTA